MPRPRACSCRTKQGRRSDAFCGRAEEESETEVVLDVERAEWKSDLLHPEPFDGRQRGHVDGATRWISTQPVQVTGNYVNINAEAAGQRSLLPGRWPVSPWDWFR